MSCYIEAKEIELHVALDGTEGERNLILWMPLTLPVYLWVKSVNKEGRKLKAPK